MDRRLPGAVQRLTAVWAVGLLFGLSPLYLLAILGWSSCSMFGPDCPSLIGIGADTALNALALVLMVLGIVAIGRATSEARIVRALAIFTLPTSLLVALRAPLLLIAANLLGVR